MPVSSGRWRSTSVKASNPPAEAPTATIVGQPFSALWLPVGGAGAAAETGERGRPFAGFFATQHQLPFSTDQKIEHVQCHFLDAPSVRLLGASLGASQKILDDFADFHELT